MKALYKALAEFQQDVPTIKKNSSGYNYKFADIEEITKAIKPLLKKHGLGYSQPLNGTELKTILFHVESGESLESSVDIPQGVALKGQNDFQVLGSAITYLRRYSLSSILGLVTDEDADAAGEQEAPRQRTATNSAPSDKQIGLIRKLATDASMASEDIENRLDKITTAKEASAAIKKLMDN